MTRTRSVLLSAAVPFLLLGMAACSSSSSSQAPTTLGTDVAALVPLASCDDVASHIRNAAIASMNQALDDARASYLKNGNQCFASDGAGTGAGGSSAGGVAPGASQGAGGGASSSKGATQVSGTNNQTVGVDEADFVKNDDKYVYLATGNAFRIVDAWPAEQAHEIAKMPLEGTPKKLFVEGDRALVYTAVPRTVDNTQPGYPGAPGYPGGAPECSYGYDCDVTGDGTATKIVVFDIHDRANPVRVRELDLSGSLIAARRIGDAVHTVVSTPDISFPAIRLWPDTLGGGCGSGNQPDPFTVYAEFEKLREANIAAIQATDVLSQLPTVKDGATGTTSLAAGCSGFYGSKLSDGSAFLTVASLDMTNDGAVTASTIVSRPGTVYASADALYVSVRHDAISYEGYSGPLSDEKELSTIHKFTIGQRPGDTAYAASGLVEGHVVDQFAMDQWNDHLRVATSTGRDPDPEVHSQITTLRVQGDRLVTAGRVGDIAPHEDIRSVRFEEERGFVVTFKKTDPLFTFDLADPTAPKMLGALQIPGFSTYMHMMDDTHLLTIGYDANDQGDFAWFAGIIVQIFDVTDPANPALTSKVVIGTRGSSSEALANHLAFNYFAPKGVLALPMTICEGGNLGSYGTDMTFNGLMVFDVSATDGIHERGRVAHPNTSSGAGYDGAVCSNWWANASSEVKRSIFMDDFVYSLSTTRMKVDSLNALGTDVASVKLDD